MKDIKILLIGATGLLGKAVMKELEEKHEIIRAARHNVDVEVDITKPDSIKRMFEQTGKAMKFIKANPQYRITQLK